MPFLKCCCRPCHVVQALSRRSPTTDAQVQSQVRRNRINSRQQIWGHVFLPVFRFYPVSIIPPMLRTYKSVTDAIQFRQLMGSINNTLRSCVMLGISFRDTALPPFGPGPHYRGFTSTLTHTPHSVGILCTSDRPDAETST